MHPKEKTPLQHRIELTVTSGMGYTDRIFSEKMRDRRLKWEDDADVQFNLAYQTLRGALTIGRKDLCSQIYPQCWQLIELRRRLALSEPAVFVTTPDQVQKAITVTTATAGKEPVYDYQLPEILQNTHSKPLSHDELSPADQEILHVGQDNLPVIDTTLSRLFQPEEVIAGYLNAITNDTQYLNTF